MHTRRKFLIQGSMATTALLASRPMSAIARITSPLTGFGGQTENLVFLHTGTTKPSGNQWGIPELIGKHRQAVLLHAGRKMPGNDLAFSYDASSPESKDSSAISGNYKIINKGKLRIGIIHASPGEENVIQKIESLSARLKKEKNCHLVVCLSHLGYRNNHAPDDLTLANKSTHLDFIIGGHEKNFHTLPVIASNALHHEVVIHSASGNPASCGIIQIAFDSKAGKKGIGFSA